MKQQNLASLTYEGMKKRTKREKFLQEMGLSIADRHQSHFGSIQNVEFAKV